MQNTVQLLLLSFLQLEDDEQFQHNNAYPHGSHITFARCSTISLVKITDIPVPIELIQLTHLYTTLAVSHQQGQKAWNNVSQNSILHECVQACVNIQGRYTVY